MIGIVLFIAAMIIIVFLNTRIRFKKNKTNTDQLNSVENYHDAINRVRSIRDIRDRDNQYKKYVTKYNSNLDYRDKNGL